MKKLNLFLSLCGFMMATQAQTISTFESLILPADTFWDGSDLTGGFADGNAYFINDFDTTYLLWNGFTYSNVIDSTTPGYLNQNSAITGSGYNGSSNYVVGNDYGFAKVRTTGNAAGKMLDGVYVTNATYTYISMRDGDLFAKQFGGPSGNDEDWLKLSVMGWKGGAPTLKTVDFYLADFRFADNTQDYLLRDWQWLNLQPLGNVDSIQFFLTSSDTGQLGMNTPAYFALDNFTTADVENLAPVALDDDITLTYLTDSLIQVGINDTDLTAAPLSIDWVTAPQIPGASASIVNNSILYQPAVGIVATDTMRYRTCDLAGLCDTALLIVRVTGINSLSANEADDVRFSVFPNPFTNDVTVAFSVSQQDEVYTIQVADMNGHLVFETSESISLIRLATTEWSSGIYFVKAITANGFVTKKLVKE